MWWRSVVWTGIIFGTFAWIIPNLIWLVSWVIGRISLFISGGSFGYRMPYAPFGWTAFGIVLIIWGCLAYGHFMGRFNAVVNEIEYASNEVPEAFDGYKVIHISDLHVDSFEKPEQLAKIVDKINEQNGDIILFTGDIVTGKMDPITIHESALKNIKANEGVISVLGNHDFFIYESRKESTRCEEADKLTDYERDELGWKVLRNESFFLNQGSDSIVIAGIDNINGNQGFKTIQKGDLNKALSYTKKEGENPFTILLSHDPSFWSSDVLPKSNIQITLSGHTHAAQVRLFGWSLAHLTFKECDGRYDKDGRMLYVNAGIGCTAPFRIGCPPEITVITLRHTPPLK